MKACCLKKTLFMLAKDQALIWACNKKKFKIFMQQCPKYSLSDQDTQ